MSIFYQIIVRDNAIVRVNLSATPFTGALPEEQGELYRRAVTQMEEYLVGRRREFDLPLQPVGTPFQMTVWNVLKDIPYGHTVTYGYIAEKIGAPKAARAVGGACNANCIPIIIPCHRVIGKSGALTGFEPGLELKKELLDLEGFHEYRITSD